MSLRARRISDAPRGRFALEPRALVYARVSTDEQTTENQIRELAAVAERQGWTVARSFVDEGISGAKGRDKRPGLDALLRAVVRREGDVVMAWSVDRLGRSLTDLLAILGEIHAKGADLYLHQQGIDTRTPAGRAMFGMMGVFAEFERSMIQARVKAGMARAKAAGKRVSRPPFDPERLAAALALKAENPTLSLRALEAATKVPRSVLHRALGGTVGELDAGGG